MLNPMRDRYLRCESLVRVCTQILGLANALVMADSNRCYLVISRRKHEHAASLQYCL